MYFTANAFLSSPGTRSPGTRTPHPPPCRRRSVFCAADISPPCLTGFPSSASLVFQKGKPSKASPLFCAMRKASMVGFISNLAPLLNYLRRRSPGPPFPPDHRQTGERGAKNRYILPEGHSDVAGSGPSLRRKKARGRRGGSAAPPQTPQTSLRRKTVGCRRKSAELFRRRKGASPKGLPVRERLGVVARNAKHMASRRDG